MQRVPSRKRMQPERPMTPRCLRSNECGHRPFECPCGVAGALSVGLTIRAAANEPGLYNYLKSLAFNCVPQFLLSTMRRLPGAKVTLSGLMSVEICAFDRLRDPAPF